MYRSQPQGPSTAVGRTVGPGRGRLPSGPGPTVLSVPAPLADRVADRRRAAVGALVVTTLATAVVVAGGTALPNGVHVALVAVACAAYLRADPPAIAVGPVDQARRRGGGAADGRRVGATAERDRRPLVVRDLRPHPRRVPRRARTRTSPRSTRTTRCSRSVGHTWRHTPSVYGPAFTALSGVASIVLGTSLLGTRLFYQGLAAAALVTACVIVWRRTRSADAVAFFALSPFTALYLVNGGRNDILVGVALLGAVVLAQRDHPTAAGVVGGLGALVKLTGMVGVVALVVALVVRGRRREARRVGIAAGLTVVGAYTLAGMSAIFTPMDTAGSLYSRESVWRLLAPARSRAAGQHRRPGRARTRRVLGHVPQRAGRGPRSRCRRRSPRSRSVLRTRSRATSAGRSPPPRCSTADVSRASPRCKASCWSWRTRSCANPCPGTFGAALYERRDRSAARSSCSGCSVALVVGGRSRHRRSGHRADERIR